jgi:hypothetical protein
MRLIWIERTDAFPKWIHAIFFLKLRAATIRKNNENIGRVLTWPIRQRALFMQRASFSGVELGFASLIPQRQMAVAGLGHSCGSSKKHCKCLNMERSLMTVFG